MEDIIEELVAIAKEGQKRLQLKGIDESDIPRIVARSRAQ